MDLRIKEIIKQKGMTITELADKMGINRVNLSNMINGNPTVETLEKIATALHVPISDLFEKESRVKSIICPHCQKTIPVEVDFKVKVE